jgi:hypothetical protein
MLLLALCSNSSHHFLCTQLRPTTALLSSLPLLSFFALLSPKNTRTIPHSHPTFTQLSYRTCLEAIARAHVGAHFRYLRTALCPSWFAAHCVHALPPFRFCDSHPRRNQHDLHSVSLKNPHSFLSAAMCEHVLQFFCHIHTGVCAASGLPPFGLESIKTLGALPHGT